MMKITIGILIMFLFTGASPRQSVPVNLPEQESYAFEEGVLRHNASRVALSRKDMIVDSLATEAKKMIDAKNANR